MLKELPYRVYGLKETGAEELLHIQRTDDYVNADFWGVYEVQDDGTEEWVADFRSGKDAEIFAFLKNKEKDDE